MLSGGRGLIWTLCNEKEIKEITEMKKMNAFIMNCSPVRNGATAEIVNVVSGCLKEKYTVVSLSWVSSFINPQLFIVSSDIV